MTLHIYGYPGCTTVKKAVNWAQENGLGPAYTHFSKTDDLETIIRQWVSQAGMSSVFNEKAQTFKKMEDSEKKAITSNEESRIQAMAADPRLIKRPVGTDGKTVLTGFDKDQWQRAFG